LQRNRIYAPYGSVGDEVSHYAFLADNPEFADVRELVAPEALAFFEANLC
jgi:hypothetical protein